eukprot:6199334-Pleurochrysis_carterae.AAC.7
MQDMQFIDFGRVQIWAADMTILYRTLGPGEASACSSEAASIFTYSLVAAVSFQPARQPSPTLSQEQPLDPCLRCVDSGEAPDRPVTHLNALFLCTLHVSLACAVLFLPPLSTKPDIASCSLVFLPLLQVPTSLVEAFLFAPALVPTLLFFFGFCGKPLLRCLPVYGSYLDRSTAKPLGRLHFAPNLCITCFPDQKNI